MAHEVEAFLDGVASLVAGACELVEEQARTFAREGGADAPRRLRGARDEGAFHQPLQIRDEVVAARADPAQGAQEAAQVGRARDLDHLVDAGEAAHERREGGLDGPVDLRAELRLELRHGRQRVEGIAQRAELDDEDFHGVSEECVGRGEEFPPGLRPRPRFDLRRRRGKRWMLWRFVERGLSTEDTESVARKQERGLGCPQPELLTPHYALRSNASRRPAPGIRRRGSRRRRSDSTSWAGTPGPRGRCACRPGCGAWR